MTVLTCSSTRVHNTVWAYRRHGCRCPEAVKRMRAKRRNDSQMPSAKVRRARYRQGQCEAAAYIDPIAVALACRGDQVRLTARERRTAINRLDTGELSARQIADLLHITERTVVRHRAARRIHQRTTRQGVPVTATIKEFCPKFGEPGSRVEFEESRDHQAVTRVGIVWARGPVPSSVWVQPDDDPTNQVAVKLPTKRAGDQHKRPTAMPEFPASWQRNAVRRCDNVRRFGCVFGVVESETRGQKMISWHADPDCVGVAGKPRYDNGNGEPHLVPASLVIDVLLGRSQRPTFLRLCLRCVYLDETAEIGATV